jgi:linoleoyl-CoA desaturase
MEIARNVLHGQWDWMRDPEISRRPGSGITPVRRRNGSTHNVVHHKWTNVSAGSRRRLRMLRVSADSAVAFLSSSSRSRVLMALFFEAFIALHDLRSIAC